MGTRGAWGFQSDGKLKVTYNHFDSYPGWLGNNVLGYIKDTNVEEMKKLFGELVMVVEHGLKPTPEQIELLKEFSDDGVGEQSLDDWYCLLRQTQGEPFLVAKAKHMIDNESFLQDSLFCEWAYIINLDTQKLEVYRGFQQKPPKGRFADSAPPDENGYYPVSLIKEIPLADCPEEFSPSNAPELFEDEDDD